jgi:hypothetical protein
VIGLLRPGVLVVAIALLAAGCALLPPPTPDWVLNRTELPECGAEEVAADRPPNREARECLINAWREGDAAELVSERRTVEGDPVTTIYRVLPDGSVELFVDMTRDRYGSGEWERLVCSGLRPVREEDGLDESWIFVEDGCGTAEPDL